MKNNPLLSTPLSELIHECSSELESLLRIEESVAGCFIAYDKIIHNSADALEKEMAVTFRKDSTLNEEDIHQWVTFVSHTDWMGGLNTLLTLALTKHNYVTMRLIDYEGKKGMNEVREGLGSQRYISFYKWTRSLIRLLYLIDFHIQKEHIGKVNSKKIGMLTILKVQQLNELFLNYGRILDVFAPMGRNHGGDNTLLESALIEIKRLENACISSPLYRPEQRLLIRNNMKQLQKNLSETLQVRGQSKSSTLKPWLNKDV